MGWLDVSSPISLGSVLSSVTLSFADAAGESLTTWPDVCSHVSVSVAPVCCCCLSGTLGTGGSRCGTIRIAERRLRRLLVDGEHTRGNMIWKGNSIYLFMNEHF